MGLLPTVKTPPKEDVRDLTILLYGRPKIGKSSFASGADGAIFLATEPGLNHLDVYQTPVAKWAEFLAACAELAAGKHDFRTVVVDTIGNAYQFCQDHVCAANKWTHPADAGYGKGFAAVNNEFRRAIGKLAALPYGLIMIAHDKALTDEKTGAVRMVPALSAGAREAVVALADLVLYAETERVRDGEKTTTIRVLRTKPATEYEAGDRTGRLPDPLILPNTPDPSENWGTFVAAFRGVTESEAA